MSIWIGRYAIVAGEVREHGPWLVERSRLREDEAAQLIVLAEPVDERSAEFCFEVADAVADLFTRESLSMTGGLLRALRQANLNLAEWNRRSLREHNVAVGVTCIALREGQATIAIVGPGIVYVAGPDGLRRLTAEAGDGGRPLGSHEQIDPQFFSTPLAGRQLLACSSIVEERVGTQAIGQALAAGPERALAELFVRTRELADMTAVLIADIDVPEELPTPADAPWTDADREPPATGDTPIPPPPVSSPPASSPPASSPPSRRRLPAGGRPWAGSGAPSGPMPALKRPRIAGGPGPPRPWRAYAIIGAVLAALVLAAVFLLPSLLESNRDSELSAALAEAEQHLIAAERASDVGGRRLELEEALAAIERAAAVAPADVRVTQLQRTVSAALDALNAVVDVEDLRELAVFEGVLTAPLTPTQLTLGGGSLWMVDGERGRIFSVDPAARRDPSEVYRAGEQYGGAEARPPISIAWDERSGRLLVLDEARTLFAIPPGGSPEVLPLRDIAELSSIDAVAAYIGNLYILDSEAGEVWRYLPAGDGFDSERDGLLGGQELTGAGGLLVDGDVFVLGQDSLRRFRLGEEQPALLQGIDRPLVAPAGVAVDGARNLVYIGDRGGRRVVVSDRGGAFVRQYRHAEFFDLRGLALSADGSTLYVLTGGAILEFRIPA